LGSPSSLDSKDSTDSFFRRIFVLLGDGVYDFAIRIKMRPFYTTPPAAKPTGNLPQRNLMSFDEQNR
jgi:hypothetical protein